ncbi:MAG: hypothetical protein QXK06_04080 [Candidatus Diapherotrites archaeon]
MEKAGVSEKGYFSRISGRLSVTSAKSKIVASIAQGFVEVELDGKKAGTIDFKSMQATTASNSAVWKITLLKEKVALVFEAFAGLRFEKEDGALAEIKPFSEENLDDSQSVSYTLFTKSNALGLSSPEEKAILAVGSIIGWSNCLLFQLQP